MVTYLQMKNSIRVKHLPSGYEVLCDKERSQHKNKDACIKTLKAKLYADKLGLERPIINERTEGTLCPICESGILVEKHEYLRYTYNSGFRLDLEGEYEVLSLYLQCQLGCGSEQMDAHCLEYNKETMLMLYEMKERELNETSR